MSEQYRKGYLAARKAIGDLRRISNDTTYVRHLRVACSQAVKAFELHITEPCPNTWPCSWRNDGAREGGCPLFDLGSLAPCSCKREKGHSGRCKCKCGSTTTRRAAA